MRISDWSSDVCSSDLLHPREFRPLEVDPVHDLESGRINDKNLLLEDIQGLSVRRHGKPGTIARAFVLRIDIDRLDRKSVGSGKSVSVRVDLGGRRIINKKKSTNINDENKHKKI